MIKPVVKGRKKRGKRGGRGKGATERGNDERKREREGEDQMRESK